MPIHRFFSKNLCSPIEGLEHHHMVHVTRLRPGEEFELIDGQGHLAICRLISIGRREAHFEILSNTFQQRAAAQIHLALPSLRQLDWALEKVTELGVDAIFLYEADRAEKPLPSLERVHATLVAAAKQSGRLHLPSVSFYPALEAMAKLGSWTFGAVGGSPFTPTFPLFFVTGPESGFSPRELEYLKREGKGASLSPYTLRAETAPIAALAIAINAFHK
jgi:16S rRNA (uracil1498-N3)-methyltransferase